MGNAGRPGGNVGINRPGVGNTVNVNNRPVNINRPTNITNIVNHTTNNTIVNQNRRNANFFGNNYRGGYPGGRRPGNWGGYWPGAGVAGGFAGPGYRPAYNAYHNGWHNGYWHGRASSGNGWGWGSFAAGAALMGVSSWGFGSSLYNWGYSSYANPYYAGAPIVQQPMVVQPPTQVSIYDYSQPIRTDVPPPDQQTAEPAVETFDRGRSAFTSGDYAGALSLANEAVSKLPNDPTIHEFRALALFALARYDDAAATLYPVLSVGPGWDWTTMIGLYGSADAYTVQLRALEDFARAHPESASPRFLLAYHYMTAGHANAAIEQFRMVVAKKPTDRLSKQLLTALEEANQARTEAATADTPPAEEPPPDPVPAAVPAGASLTGTWKAAPAPGVSINLILGDDGRFTWAVNQDGQAHEIAGTSTLDGDLLTLDGGDDAPLAGRIQWSDKDHFAFQVIESGADDPGLQFAR